MKLTKEELLRLYDAPLEELRHLADASRRIVSGDKVYYNRNFHIEPSNICAHRCKFCSYRRDDASQEGAWSMSIDEIASYCQSKFVEGTTEVHIVGSVHPDKKLDYYRDIITTVRSIVPAGVTIKAYTAVEIDDMCRYNSLSLVECLSLLKEAGLRTMPGGGAEIFADHIRRMICPDKASSARWLEIHRAAHRIGIPTNCTMLYGHIESRKDRIDHLLTLRSLQDETGGFNAFIPLRYSSLHNNMSSIGQVPDEEVLRTIAISRLALYNIPHIKAYWPMLGKTLSIKALSYGADDIDGTINDSTRIYSMAGSTEQRPVLTVSELKALAEAEGFRATERDSFYNIIS